jgi:N-acetylmuramoyl-L-alanine amidase
MNKRKTIIIISAVLALAAAAALILGVTLRKSGKEKPADETTVSVTEKERDKSAESKEKQTPPAFPLAVIFDSFGEDAQDKIEKLGEYGFNTVIFDYNKNRETDIKTLIEKAKEKELYAGIRFDCKNSENTVKFINSVSPGFIIITGDGAEANKSANAVSDLYYTGFEAHADSDTESISGFDFIFVNQADATVGSFTKSLDSWFEFPADIWVCFNSRSFADITASETESIIGTLGRDDYSELSAATAFSSYSGLLESDSAQARTICEFIKNRETHLLSKDFEITNYADKNITTDKPEINFRGTSSPLYDLLCDGKEVERTENGDFTIDCKLAGGANTITFSHKGKDYKYNVNYKVTLLKSVSPQDSINVPSGMTVDFYAVALENSNVTLLFNGNSYTMKAVIEESDDDFESPSGFSTYKTTLKMPAGGSAAKNMGVYKVTAASNGLTETKSGASITVNPAPRVTIEKVRTTAPRRSSMTSTSATSAAPATQITTTAEAASTESMPSTRVKRGNRTTTSRASATSSQSDTQSASTQANQRLQKYSYSSDYGLGKAKIVEVIDDYCEVYPGSNLSTNSIPDCSPFLKGTADYMTGTAAIDSDTYYYLNSGYKIPYSRKDNSASGKVTVTHIKVSDGYIMPSNSVNIVSCETVNGNTKIKLDMNRKVPFNARLTGQTYTDNGFGRKYKVNAVDFTGIEFTFFDTVSITGSLDFGSSMLSKGKASVSGDQAKLTVSFTNKGRFYGWHCEYDSQGYLIITIKKKPASISEYTIMIDAGHGGVDSGAACAVSSGAWNEKKLNLSIASKIKNVLENEGARVIMTRSGDSYLSLASRTAMIRKYHPDLFISVHCDAAGTSSAYGTTAYYYRAFSQPLAKYVHESIVSAYNNSIYAGMNRKGTDRGTLYGCYRVTRVEECPSILVEYGFVTEAVECRAMQNSTNRDILAKATVNGIKKYIANS